MGQKVFGEMECGYCHEVGVEQQQRAVHFSELYEFFYRRREEEQKERRGEFLEWFRIGFQKVI